MAVSMADISHLRKMSGAGMMDCKKALEEANGDFDKAMEIIRKKGQAVAAKRSDREATEGCVLAQSNGSDFACIVAINCETDFVAKNEDFVGMTREVLEAAMSSKPESKEALLATTLSDGRTVADRITDRSGITGEKMELSSYEFVKGAATVEYVHPGNKLATIVAFNEGLEHQAARDVAMQVAAMNPVGVTPDSVPQNIIDQELEIARDKAREAGKPENLLDRIAEGALQKYYKENTLLMQESIKNPKETVEQVLKGVSKTLTVLAFKRVNLNVD
ncbi:translation elongation factor Ts [Porphyromonas cangingivalis]|uniref:translation elongation factor Ts n=1 Tax=Porphyromonas cangingivalis TaxID=36874 RepID=UPI0024306BD0|nr:translation elongation factor Ts [Porphyromonas cangingivalis]